MITMSVPRTPQLSVHLLNDTRGLSNTTYARSYMWFVVRGRMNESARERMSMEGSIAKEQCLPMAEWGLHSVARGTSQRQSTSARYSSLPSPALKLKKNWDTRRKHRTTLRKSTFLGALIFALAFSLGIVEDRFLCVERKIRDSMRTKDISRSSKIMESIIKMNSLSRHLDEATFTTTQVVDGDGLRRPSWIFLPYHKCPDFPATLSSAKLQEKAGVSIIPAMFFLHADPQVFYP